jgi:hypothetical protein
MGCHPVAVHIYTQTVHRTTQITTAIIRSSDTGVSRQCKDLDRRRCGHCVRRNFGIWLPGDIALHPKRMNSSTTPMWPLKMHTCILRVPSLPLFSPYLSSVFLSKFHISAQFHWTIISCIPPFTTLFLISPPTSTPHWSFFVLSLSIPLFLNTMFFALSSSHYSSPSILFSSSLFIPELSSLLYILRFCASVPLSTPFRSGHSILTSPQMQIREHKFSFTTVRLKLYSLHKS